MRIALFTEVFLPKVDGVVTRVLRTLEELGRMGHQVLVFAPGSPPASYAGHRVQRVRSFSLRPIYPELKVGLPTVMIAEQMIAFRPDVVHAVNPVALAAFGVGVAHHRHLPLLASYHTGLGEYMDKLRVPWARSPMQRWTRFLHNRAEVNLCTSATMVRRAESHGVMRLGLWPKAVDTTGYRPDKADPLMRARLTDGHPDAPLAIYVGRLSREKDLLDLLTPIRRLAPRGVRLAIVGSGPQRRELEEAFATTPTVFTGYLAGDELARAYASSDVFCFPSTTETLGLVALEAMASGVPVIGARAGGIPDVISDGVDGFLVAPHNADELCARLSQLVEDPALRTSMATSARAEAERHDWHHATSCLVQNYRLAIARHAAGPRNWN
ncbi:Glycosyltransferase involved in cell wall bisynthesis [Propionibacterium cyclohexanicum]|uniref:Glycosyltransferase involved in cell wall bisynthesis n=1 Tax=Propionibacterium cyclohexanicum TaxID=64702 RepID=A0A1H9TSH8_9ACTN|nr:glycosyltransferase family 1 protein [Propionibacterium cyclohexanicum]SER99994.1 Glycosyltransferase involved in cell wall bisynthesis [Propionibacterium cyclohexanicum]